MLFKLNQGHAGLHKLASTAQNPHHPSVARSPNRQLHLHRLEHDEEIASSHLLSGSHANVGDTGWHWRGQRQIAAMRANGISSIDMDLAAGRVDQKDAALHKHPPGVQGAGGVRESLPDSIRHAEHAIPKCGDVYSVSVSHATLAVLPMGRL